ncbi:bifunctional glutathionylspermidine amidase/glutathionylspermidine synthetase [Proteus mirabilis]|uniref:Bifunctional glutathionylspermidine amidase/glutathionylspermidine synthetase n=1 Tax=Proteus mirabilis TaxID=584 RepID=A0A379FJ13_PROMI|nr:bifunctional glutathionylspermidine amidase/glutathionylspermidine synthetase [Proteus mirabilis]
MQLSLLLGAVVSNIGLVDHQENVLGETSGQFEHQENIYQGVMVFTKSV